MKATTLKQNQFPLTAVRFVMAVLLLVAPTVFAATDTWVGNSSALFSGPNWTGGNNPPISLDALVFGAAGSSGTSLTADQTAAISYAGITFSAGASAFTIGGANGITLTGNVVNNGTSLETLSFPIAATAVRTFTTTAGGGDIALGGNFTGTGAGITKTGSGTLTLSGVNSFTGAFADSAGRVNVTANSTTAGGGFNNLGNTASTAAILATSSGATLNWSGANGGNFGGAASASGTLYNDGAFSVSGTTANNCGIYLGNAATAYGYIRNTGTATVSGRVWVGQGSGALGVLDIAGGTFTVGGTNQNAAFQVSANSAATASSSGINVTAGTLVIGPTNVQTYAINTGNNNYTAINITGAGKVTTAAGAGFNLVNTANANNVTTLSLASGGELDTQYMFNNSATPTSVINFNNGTLKATGTDGNGLIINNTAVYLYSGGATIDANGFNPKIAVPLLAPVADGITTYGVTGISLGGTATGYIGAPLVKISGGGGKGAAAIANFNPATGTITGITVTAPGSGYTTAPTVTLLGGNGGTTGSAAGTATATASMGAVSSGGLTKIGNGVLLLPAANTYTGSTVVGVGTLMLTNSGSLASGNIIVSNNATFDVSGISFTLGGSQSLLGSGTNNGNVNTTSGSKIYAGTDGGYATNTFNGNLTLVSGATAYFDLTTNFNGKNDLINVLGSLTDNGSVQVSAPSASVNLDTNQDYVLITAAGISGTVSPTPLWGVKPLNWRNFTLVQNGGNLQLHYTATTPPVAAGVASPATVTRNQSTLVSVTVSPGTGAIDPNTGVVLDASPVGASSVYLVLSGTPNVYTNTLVIPPSAAIGNYSLNVLVADSSPLTGSANVSIAVVATNRVWNGAGANNYTDNNTNWVSGLAPGFVGDGLTFAGSVNTSPDLDQNYTLTGIAFNSNAASFTLSTAESTTLTLTNGSGVVNNSSNAQTLNVPVVLSTAQTINAASGNLSLNGSISGTGALTKTGNATLLLSGDSAYSGDTTLSAGALTFSGTGSSSIGNLLVSAGQLNVTAGTVTVNETTGNNTQVNSNSVVVISGGTLTLNGAAGWLPIGNTVGTTSTVTVAGGTFNVANGFGSEVGRIGYGVLNINSGTFSSTDTHNIGLVIGDQATAQGGTVNLNGGTMAVNKFVSNNGTNYFYFNGGTLSPTAANASWWANFTKLSAQVRNGGAVVDTAGFDVTLGQPLVHSAVGGDSPIDGGLTKNGNGTLNLTNASTYTGDTIVNGGILAFTGAGSIVSPNIVVASGATYDVSAITGYSLNAGQSLLGSGVNNGSITVPSGSKVYAGTNGGYGTNTFNNDLTLNSGAIVNLDLGTAYNATNDQVTVVGTLTLNGNSIHLKAPSTSSSFDTTADYVLISAGSIVGSFSSTPVWDVKPVNWANYTVLTSGGQVTLHYSTLTPPTGSGFASPSTAVHNQNVLISVTVTNGSGTVDPNTGVVLNASTIGGPSSVNLVLANTISGTIHVYTNTITVPVSPAAGSYTLTAVITDSNGQIGTANIALNVTTTEVWNGGATDQNWSTNPNWVSSFAPDLTGDSLIFAGSVGTAPNMDGSYSVTGLTFSNNAASFTIGSSTSSTLTLTGGITNNSANAQTLNVPIADAGGGLTKSGNGTVILAGINTYTGNTTINAGVLNIGGAGQLNSGAYAAGIVDNGGLTYSSSAAQTFSGIISGTGTLADLGASTLVLDTASNTFSGNITVGGYLLATNGFPFNFGNAPVQGPLGNPQTAGRTITVNSGGTLVFGAGNIFGAGISSVAPAVSLIINQGGTVQTTCPIPTFPGNGGGDANIFGDIILNGGTLSTGNGYANSPDYQSAILMGSITVGGSTASTINTIASNPNANGLMLGKQGGGTVTFNVATTGAGSADLIVTAPLVNAANNTTGALLKTGAGTLQLDATNTYAGSTTVSNGTLVGIGSIAGPVVVASAGTIGAGHAGTSVGTLTVNNSLTLQGMAKFRISKTGGTLTNDLITGLSTATYGGSLVVSNITSDATPLAAGDTFTLFSAGTHSGSFTSIVGSPGTGLTYSFNSGVLSVVASMAGNPTNITFSVSGSTLALSWPADHLGWILQTQTNSLGSGLSNNWVDVSGSAAITSTNIAINPALPTAFYRLRHP